MRKWRKKKKRGGEEGRTGVLSNADDESWGGGLSSLFFPFREHPPPSPLLSLCVTAGVGNLKGRTKTSSLSSLGLRPQRTPPQQQQSQPGGPRGGGGQISHTDSTVGGGGAP